jgi:hypothetical protein
MKKEIIVAVTTSSVLPEDRCLNEGIKEETILNAEKYIPKPMVYQSSCSNK